MLDWLLIHVGFAILWLRDALLAGGGALLRGIAALLNPVLSPLLRVLNPVCTAAGDAVYAVLNLLPPWLGITLLSAVVGVLMLIAFRYTSNQAAIGRARDRISASLLSLKLYKDELRVALRAQGRLLAALGRLQWHMLRPMLIMAFPLMLVVAQMGLRYQWRPLYPGEQTVLRVEVAQPPTDGMVAQPPSDNTVRVAGGSSATGGSDDATRAAPPGLAGARLAPSPGIAEAVGPVPGGGEWVWRIRAGQPGRHSLKIELEGVTIEKELVVAPAPSSGGRPGTLRRVSAERPGRRWTAQLLHPAERPLPADSPARAVTIAYPGVDSWVVGADWWILYFLVVSLIAALLAKPLVKVRL